MNWSTYFMGIAEAASKRSKDPVTRVGACVVNKHMDQIATGYNGFPASVEEKAQDWQRPNKYAKVVHAEMNAIIRALRREDLRGCYLYTTLQPCCDCLKLIAAVGIDRVFFKNELREAAESYALATSFGITLNQMEVEVENTAHESART